MISERTIWSIKEVYEDKASLLTKLTGVFHTQAVELLRWTQQNELPLTFSPTKDFRTRLAIDLNALSQDLESIGSASTLYFICRIIRDLQDDAKDITFGSIDHDLRRSAQVFEDEIHSWHIVLMNNAEAKIYDHGESA